MIKDNVYYEMMSTENPMNIKDMKMILVKGAGRELDFAFHWHDALEITLLRKGCGRYVANGKEYAVRAGEIIFVNIGDIHMMQNVDDYSECGGLIMLIPHSYLRELVPEVEEPYFEVSDSAGKILAMYLEQIAVCLENKPAYMNLLIRKQLLSIIYQLYEKCYVPRPAHERVISKRVVEYVNQKYADPLTVKSVSEYAGLQENYFCRYFKKETGIPFHQYLCTVRLNAALELLATGQHSELECALASGFTSSKTLIDWCKKIYGCTPLTFVKEK